MRKTFILVAAFAVLIGWRISAQFGGLGTVQQPMLSNAAATEATNNIGFMAFSYWSFDTASPAFRTNDLMGRMPTHIGFMPASTTGINGEGLSYVAADAGGAAPYEGTQSTNLSTFYTNGWTVSMWVDIDEERMLGGLNQNTFLASVWSDDTSFTTSHKPARYWKVGYETNGFCTFRVLAGGYSPNPIWVEQRMWATNTAITNGWVHLVFGYDYSNSIWFQTNGGPRISTRVTNAIAPQRMGYNFAGFTIGNCYSGSQGLKGKVDEVVIWKRTLSTNEVSLLYGGGTSPLFWNSAWTNDYAMATNWPELWNPSKFPQLVVDLDALKNLNMLGNGTVPITNGTRLTNWYNNVPNVNANQQINQVWIRKEATLFTNWPVYYSSGAGTNGTKPRVRFGQRSNLSNRAPGNSGDTLTLTNYTILGVFNIVDTAGHILISDSYPGFAQYPTIVTEWVLGSQRAYIDWTPGTSAALNGGTTLGSNFGIYTFVVSNSVGFIKTNGALYKTAAITGLRGFGPVSINGIIGDATLVHDVNYDLARLYIWGTNLYGPDLIEAEMAAAREYDLAYFGTNNPMNAWNIAAWWRARDLPEAQTTVTNWVDYKQGITLIQPTNASAPIKEAGSKSGVLFDGSNDYLYVADSGGIPYEVNYTNTAAGVTNIFFCIFRTINANPATPQPLYGGTNSTSTYYSFDETAGTYYFQHTGSGRDIRSPTATPQTNVLVAFMGEQRSGGHRAWTNGVDAVVQTPASTIAYFKFHMLGRQHTLAGTFQGRIYEIGIITNTAITQPLIDTFADYAKNWYTWP